jgi:hypothetical protein
VKKNVRFRPLYPGRTSGPPRVKPGLLFEIGVFSMPLFSAKIVLAFSASLAR